MNTPSPPDVTIIGAGLAGALLARLLAQQGMSVHVYEKRPDMRRTDISAGRSINLALAKRGIHALKYAGLYEQLQPHLVPMSGRLLHSPDGSTELQRYGLRDEEVIYSVSRGGLNMMLLNAAESMPNVRFEFDVHCDQVDLADQRLHFSESQPNGETRTHQVPYCRLIGADGASSAVREAIVAARGGTCDLDFLDHGYKELSIPAGQGGEYQLEPNALHIWPRGGFMLIGLPNSDGSFTMTLFLPHEGRNSFAALDSPNAVQSFFETQFADAAPLIGDLVHSFERNPTGPLGTVWCDTWRHEDTALILGDAAHAIVPFHGQGMNCAMEDCAWLGQALEESPDWGAVLGRFEETRKPAADAIATMALENYVTMRDSVRDPKFHLKKQLEFELERRFPDRFIPRYSMVMFHRIPYDEVLRRGKSQEKLLEQLLQDANRIEDLDTASLEAAVNAQ